MGTDKEDIERIQQQLSDIQEASNEAQNEENTLLEQVQYLLWASCAIYCIKAKVEAPHLHRIWEVLSKALVEQIGRLLRQIKARECQNSLEAQLAVLESWKANDGKTAKMLIVFQCSELDSIDNSQVSLLGSSLYASVEAIMACLIRSGYIKGFFTTLLVDGKINTQGIIDAIKGHVRPMLTLSMGCTEVQPRLSGWTMQTATELTVETLSYPIDITDVYAYAGANWNVKGIEAGTHWQTVGYAEQVIQHFHQVVDDGRIPTQAEMMQLATKALSDKGVDGAAISILMKAT